MAKPKITFIGAGSTVFARTLMGDILSLPALRGATLSLFDIDPERLRLSEAVGRRIADLLGVHCDFEVTTDRKRALDGADYAISMFQVGGYRPGTVTDFEVPRRFGLRQTVGDTVGIGGIMRGLRTVPVLLDIAGDMEELCPDVVHLNYVNPMAINCWALDRATSIETVGLCHSVTSTAAQLAEDIGVPVDDVSYVAAGINHMAFYLKFERNGDDLYPAIRRVVEEGRVPDWNRVRYDLLGRLGYFVTESSEHLAEYVPWFIKQSRPELLERYNIPLDEYPGRCQMYEVAWEFIEQELEHPGSQDPAALRQAILERDITVMPRSIEHNVEDFGGLKHVERSTEYASTIIHSLETGEPSTIHGNVRNDELIDNLPAQSCVEVPCTVDADGIHPVRIGGIPPQLAALMQTNINVQALTVEAVLTGTREHIYHAAMLDPHTGAELTLDEIWSLVDDLLDAHRDWLPDSLLEHRP